MSCSIETMTSPFSVANFRRASKRIIAPSSWTTSAIIDTGRAPARRANSTPASVWPGRSRTPPSFAMRGNT